MRTDLKSALISKEWQLDNESKVYSKDNLPVNLYYNDFYFSHIRKYWIKKLTCKAFCIIIMSLHPKKLLQGKRKILKNIKIKSSNLLFCRNGTLQKVK